MRVGREGGLGLEWYGGYFEAGAQVGLGLANTTRVSPHAVDETLP